MSLAKCWIEKFYTPCASIGGGRGGRVPLLFSLRGQHRKYPHTVSVHTTHLKAYIARLITPLSYKLYIGLVAKLIKNYTSSDINFRLPSGKSLDKLLGWPQPAT